MFWRLNLTFLHVWESPIPSAVRGVGGGWAWVALSRAFPQTQGISFLALSNHPSAQTKCIGASPPRTPLLPEAQDNTPERVRTWAVTGATAGREAKRLFPLRAAALTATRTILSGRPTEATPTFLATAEWSTSEDVVTAMCGGGQFPRARGRPWHRWKSRRRAPDSKHHRIFIYPSTLVIANRLKSLLYLCHCI